MIQKTSLLLVFWSTLAIGQITKEQLYELVDKRVDTAVIVTMLEQNCVSFETDGETVVELASRVPSEVLKAVVDCQAEGTHGANAPMPKMMVNQPGAISRVSMDAFRVHQFIEFQIESNKSSFKALEIELRLSDPDRPGMEPIVFGYKGQSNEEEPIRCYRSSGAEFVEPGTYTAYLYVVSERNKGLLARKSLRTDIHKMMVEYQGSGPISVAYNSKEDRTFKSKKAIEVTTSGPMVIHSEEQAGFDGLKSFEEVTRLFQEQ